MRRGMLWAVAAGALSWNLALAQAPASGPSAPPPNMNLAPQVQPLFVQTSQIVAAPAHWPAGQPLPPAPAPGSPGFAPAPPAETLAPAAACASEACGSSHRPADFWGEAEYLYWWLKPVSLRVATLTTGSAADAVPGAIGQPHTQVLQGQEKFEFDGLSGVRVRFGFGLSQDKLSGVMAEGFLLENAVKRFGFISGPGTPATYLPYLDPSGTPQALPFTVPNSIGGSSFAKGESRLWNVEGNVYCGCERDCGFAVLRGALLFGVRYLDLDDGITLRNRLFRIADPNAQAIGEDTFSTRNQFIGGQVGAKAEVQWGEWTFELVGKLAMGDTHQSSGVEGSPAISATGGSSGASLLPGPLFALPTNTGMQRDDRFTFIPEVSARLRLDVSDYVSVSVGYTFLYWNGIVSPGEQMDPHVNVTQLPGRGPFTGTNVPAPQFERSNFFARGFTAGIEFRY